LSEDMILQWLLQTSVTSTYFQPAK